MVKAIGFVVCALVLTADLASAQVLYGVSGNGGGPSTLYTINLSTGAATAVGSTGFSGIGSLPMSPGGVLYGVAGTVPESGSARVSAGGFVRPLVSINTTTGVATAVGETAIECNTPDIAFNPGGTLFATDVCSSLYTINTTTGAATFLNSTGCFTGPGGGLAFNAAGFQSV